jgi:hypothetical protein
MNRELNQGDGKKTYAPPHLTVISLRPEEAVLGHCKMSGSAGLSGPGCQPIGFCNSQGS